MTSQLLETRKLIMAGQMPLWLDFRSGHCLNLAGVLAGGAVADDGVVEALNNDYRCSFRTGVGFNTVHDYAATPLSCGFIFVADDPLFYPGSQGFSLIASYLQSDDSVDAHIIGQYDSTDFANSSWELRRLAAGLRVYGSDGVAEAFCSHVAAASPAEIETVTVRYTGGVGAGNCRISILAPTPSSTLTQLTRVPQDAKAACTVGACINTFVLPFHGDLRYVAVIRNTGNPSVTPTQATLAAVAAEMEAINWETGVAAMSRHGGTDARRVHYSSRFGPDVSIDEGTGVGTQISNSDWCYGPNGGVQNAAIDAVHFYQSPLWALEGIDKVLRFDEEAM